MEQKNNNKVSGKENSVRVINSDFQKALKEKSLKHVTQLIKDNDDLIMCFRGKYINIYYKGHSLFRIEQMLDKEEIYYKAEFDFNHARYTKEWAEVLEELKSLGYSLNHKNQEIGNRNRVFAIINPENMDFDFWNKSQILFRKLMDDYFSLDEDKLYDYFKMCKSKSKKNLIEKQRQQKIAIANTNCDNGYFIYDIEYTQPRNSKNEKNSGRFDMLALKFENKIPVELVFIELKSDKKTCKGKSGIGKHYEDLKKYTDNPNYIRIRKEEAISIVNLYSSLNIISANKIEEATNLNIKILFIFTDTARMYFKENNIPYDEQIELEDGDNVIKL